jgi:hypothetical protein
LVGVDRWLQAEEAQELLLLVGEFGCEILDEGAVAVEAVPTGRGEDFQDPFGGWCGAVAELWVEGDLVGVGLAHPVSGFAFDEGADEEGQELAAEQGLDPGRVAQGDGCGVLDGFEHGGFRLKLRGSGTSRPGAE